MSAAPVRRLLDRAYELADAGDYAGSLALADRAVELDPDNAEAHTARGWALENLGSVRLGEAYDAYRRALALDEGELWAALGLATVLTRFGDPHAAEQLYRKVVDEAPSRLDAEPDLAEALGWAQHRVGMHSLAIATLRRHLERTPDDVAVRLDLALILLVAGFPREALAEMRTALDGSGATLRGVLAVALDDLEATLVERPGLSAFGGGEARMLLASALGRARGKAADAAAR